MEHNVQLKGSKSLWYQDYHFYSKSAFKATSATKSTLITRAGYADSSPGGTGHYIT